jgi:hypothetical protein
MIWVLGEDDPENRLLNLLVSHVVPEALSLYARN